jgi:F-type H+-transporting ATPase subunit delta
MAGAQRQYSPIASSYATALFRAARRQGIVQRLMEETRVLREVLSRTADIDVFMSNPRVASEDKHALIDTVFKTRLSPLLMNVLHLSIDRDRTLLLDQMLERFQDLVEESEGIHHAIIETARELGFQEKLQLKAALEKFTASKLRIEYAVDPALIGGIVFRYGDTLIDSSIRRGLGQIAQRLRSTQVLGASV